MPFRFFRPWEDGGQGNTCQTPNPRQGASSGPSQTIRPLSVQAEQRGVNSEATRSVQVLSDIPGPMYQEKEAQSTKRKDVGNASQWASPSAQNLLVSQDRALRQTSASTSSGYDGSVGMDSDCTDKEEENCSQHSLNHIEKGSSQTDKHSSEAKKTPSSIMSKHLTSFVALQNAPSLQTTSAYVSLAPGNTLCTQDSLACSSTVETEDDDFHTKVVLDLSAFTKGASDINSSRVDGHSSMLEKQQQQYSLSTPPKDKCCVEILSDASSAGRQEHRQNESKPFPCKTCGKSFSKSSHMHRHEKIHTKSRPFQCTVCSKTFSRLDILQTHKRSHSGCKPYQCPVCYKAFSYLNNFYVHERIHTGSKPFKCSVCKKAFKHSSNLCRHERIHTGSKPFGCNVCAKAFKQSSNLHIHERIHTGFRPFKCSVCKKAFKQSGDLRRHERIHTGSRPLKCSVCEKAFTQSSHLLGHERIHTESKAFKCSLCEKAFTQSSALCRHERLHRIQTIST